MNFFDIPFELVISYLVMLQYHRGTLRRINKLHELEKEKKKKEEEIQALEDAWESSPQYLEAIARWDKAEALYERSKGTCSYCGYYWDDWKKRTIEPRCPGCGAGNDCYSPKVELSYKRNEEHEAKLAAEEIEYKFYERYMDEHPEIV